MPALFDLLEYEPEPSVRAVPGHWLLGRVHPFPDGDRRLARFVMNAMFASRRNSWTIIHLNNCDADLAALEYASVIQDIQPLAHFVADQARWSMEQQGLSVRSTPSTPHP